jgi:UDP-glucose 4-epimerase
MTEPIKYYENNFGSTLKLLQTMNKFGCKKIVFSSTAATYGEPVNTPILESDPTIPTNVYGETKLAVEKLLRWTEEAYGIKYVSLRYFNAAGAHRSGDIGEDHAPETHLIPVVLQVALGKRGHISVFGDDYATADGTCIRDYIHVTDLASAHIAAVARLNTINESGIYNLGSGSGFSVREVIDVCREVTGHPIPEVLTPRRAGDPAILVASNERASKELGFSLRYPSLKEIVATAWEFHKKFPNGYGE